MAARRRQRDSARDDRVGEGGSQLGACDPSGASVSAGPGRLALSLRRSSSPWPASDVAAPPLDEPQPETAAFDVGVPEAAVDLERRVSGGGEARRRARRSDRLAGLRGERKPHRERRCATEEESHFGLVYR